MDRVLFSLEDAVDAVGGRFVGPSLNQPVSGVSIDTRSLKPGDLFVALSGENTDGHNFLEAAFAAGAAGALIRQNVWEELSHDLKETGAFILVDDPLAALQRLARWYLDSFPSLLKVAVTGSNGKTTTKELIASVLRKFGNTYVSGGNFNSEIGLPLSVFGLTAEHIFGVFELGTNRRGEIGLLADILKPNIALVTNVGTAHIGMFGSRQAIADEKGDIFSCFDASSRGLIWENEEFAARLQAGKRGNFHFFGEKSTEGVEELESRGLAGGIIRYRGREIPLSLPGHHNLINACAAISVARMCGVDDEAVADGLSSFSSSFGRSEFLNGDVSVYQDCYNANFESFKAGLAVLKEADWTGGRIIGVFGSMKELGAEEQELHFRAGKLCAETGFDAWFFYGDEAKTAYEKYRTDSDAPGFWETEFSSLEEKLVKFVRKGDLVYLKGSRSMGLERLTGSLTGFEGRKQAC